MWPGHGKGVAAVCFSPDGRRLASGSYDKTIRVWDAATGTPTVTIPGDRYGFVSIAFSPDGRHLAGVSVDGVVRVWDAATGEAGISLSEATGFDGSIAFSPDGGRLVTTTTKDNVVRVWDAATGRPTASLLGHTSSPRCARFHPDGKTLASGSTDGTVRYWDIDGGRPRFVGDCFGHVIAVCFDPEGRRLATAAVRYVELERKIHSQIKVWDVATGRAVLELIAPGDEVTALCFSPDGKRLARANGDGSVQVWDATRNRLPDAYPKNSAEPPAPKEATHQGKDLSTWVKDLSAADAKTRGDAVAALGRMGPEARTAAASLGTLLADPDRDVGLLAAMALPKLGEDGVKELAAGCSKDSEVVRSRAGLGLVATGRPAVPHLVALLGSEKQAAVGTASGTLAQIGPDAVPALVDALRDRNAQVRGFAALSLGAMGKSARDAVPAVRSLLNDDHAGVRKAAADALGKISP